jgi:hypothetical protein
VGWAKDAWEMIKQMVPAAGLRLLDKRIRNHPHFHGNYSAFRVFSDASTMKGFTSTNYLVLMQLLPCAIGWRGGVISDRVKRDQVQKALRLFNSVFKTLTKSSSFSEDDLVSLDADCFNLQEAWKVAFPGFSIKPKFHAVVHFSFYIRLFGSPKNWDTETYELFHKAAAKIPWKQSNHKTGYEGRMLVHYETRNLMLQMRAIAVSNNTQRVRVALGSGVHPGDVGVYLVDYLQAEEGRQMDEFVRHQVL